MTAWLYLILGVVAVPTALFAVAVFADLRRTHRERIQ